MNTFTPMYVQVFFVVTTLITLWLFVNATSYKKQILLFSIGWLLTQGILSYSGFYLQFDSLPPRLIFLVTPVILFIIVLFNIKSGKKFIDSFDQEKLTWVHVVRVPVEIVLFWLFIYKQIPELMTFEGRNLDILSGITAPFIAFFGFRHGKISKQWLLIWNFGCLALLLNVVIQAILSTPFPFQQMAFDQPNVGVLYFPYSWLPCFIVPVVLFAHFVQIRFLVRK